ncbi:MAG: hypothetical protein EXR72_16160 [Myxococcales bacterium]|nr:hypothetical protein [Myxococcales bacterium]
MRFPILLLGCLVACGPAPARIVSGEDMTVIVDGGVAPEGGASADLVARNADLANPASPDLAAACPMPCVGATPVCDPVAHACAPCLPAKDVCAAGAYCDGKSGDYHCLPGCKANADCGVMACCNHACIDVAADAKNCGGCGKACAGNGSCCAAACVDTATSLLHCGGCGKACPSGLQLHAMIGCAMGACVVAGCAIGYTDCDKDPGNGCEANVLTDPANCGGCGKFCNIMGGDGACANGACSVKSCYAGFADCNKDVADGCEVATTKDPANCGVCGKKCTAPPHAQATCAGGMCGVGTCDAGFDDCDANAANGCETMVTADVKNCGKCGNACLPAHGVGGCMNSMCSILSCTMPFADCDLAFNSGCEVDLLGDPNHCKACGMKCPAPPNASATCQNGACGTGACTMGFGDCNNKLADGCEVNLLADKSHCAKCGNACPGNQTCVNGACVNSLGFLYMTSSNGTAGFYRYAVESNTWQTLLSPPSVTYSQLTTDGKVIYHLGTDNTIYRWDGNAWAMVQAGPGGEASQPIALFKWTTGGTFYYVNDGTVTMKRSTNGAPWTTVNLPSNASCAGTYDPTSNRIYIRIYSGQGLMIYDTIMNIVTKTVPNAAGCGENSRTGSYYGGFFYTRDSGSTFQKLDVGTGMITNTAVTPSESHTATDVNPNNGDLFVGPYSPTGKTLQVYRPGNNQLTTLAPAPVAVTNHSTIVWSPQ